MTEMLDPRAAIPSARQVGMTLAARLVAMIGPFGVSIITARLLGPEDRGRYFFILSLAQIAAQIATLGLHSSNTYLAAGRREIVGRLAVNSLFVAAVVAPLVAAVVLLCVIVPQRLDLVGSETTAVGPSALLALLLAPLIVAFLFLGNLAVAIGRIQLFNGLTLLAGFAALAAAAMVGMAGGSTAAFLVAAAGALGASSVLAAACLFAGAPARWTFDVALFREGVAFALRAYIAALLGFLLMRIGIIALQQHGTFAELGQFSIATQITDAMILLPATVALLLFPNLVRASPGERWPAMWRTFWRLGGLMMVALLVSAALIPVVLPRIFGSAYEAAVPITLAMLPTVLLITLAGIVSQYLAAEGHPWRQVRAWLIGFLAQAILSFMLAPAWGALGIAWALLISNGAALFLLVWEAHAMKRRRAG